MTVQSSPPTSTRLARSPVDGPTRAGLVALSPYGLVDVRNQKQNQPKSCLPSPHIDHIERSLSPVRCDPAPTATFKSSRIVDLAAQRC